MILIHLKITNHQLAAWLYLETFQMTLRDPRTFTKMSKRLLNVRWNCIYLDFILSLFIYYLSIPVDIFFLLTCLQQRFATLIFICTLLVFCLLIQVCQLSWQNISGGPMFQELQSPAEDALREVKDLQELIINPKQMGR